MSERYLLHVLMLVVGTSFIAVSVVVAAAPNISSVSSPTSFVRSPRGAVASTTVKAAKQDSCFGYYHFGSVDIGLNADKQTYKAGETAKFVGSLTNKNTYPLVDGSLILRVSRPDPKSQVGSDIIEEWVAKEDINLKAGERMPVSFNYQLPSGLTTGNYELISYFVTSDKFNISGLSFSEDIPGGYALFNVDSDTDQALRFDRVGVKVNGKPYSLMGFITIAPSATPKFAVSLPLVNGLDKTLSADVSYSLYGWDGRFEGNLLKVWSEKASLGANSSKTLSFDVPADDRTLYYVVIKSLSGDQKSEVHIRLAKEGFRPRLNFVGVDIFPLAAGKKATLFACYHNTGDSVANGRLDLELLDVSGGVLANASYDGGISGAIKLLKKDIPDLGNLDLITLTAKLYDDKNRLVDEAKINYNCARFGDSLCFSNKSAAAPRTPDPYFFFGGAALLAAALYLLYKYRRKKENPNAI